MRGQLKDQAERMVFDDDGTAIDLRSLKPLNLEEMFLEDTAKQFQNNEPDRDVLIPVRRTMEVDSKDLTKNLTTNQSLSPRGAHSPAKHSRISS